MKASHKRWHLAEVGDTHTLGLGVSGSLSMFPPPESQHTWESPRAPRFRADNFCFGGLSLLNWKMDTMIRVPAPSLP
jgi:hypothetical protein